MTNELVYLKQNVCCDDPAFHTIGQAIKWKFTQQYRTQVDQDFIRIVLWRR